MGYLKSKQFKTPCKIDLAQSCRIRRLHLCRRVRPTLHNECPRYDAKQSNGEFPEMLELRGMLSTPSLLSLPGPLWPGVVAPDKVK